MEAIDSEHPGLLLCEPLGYLDFLSLLADAGAVLTDSGGIQEEAPALGKPVLVLRHATERPEVIEEGVAQLVGSDGEAILGACRRLLTDAQHYARMSRVVLPYGDGHAAERIRDVLGRA
jgi:UDP-N-acetylglucosamine 2-epimerase (non-hydrolysing)